jgi:hypothetical protein
MVTSLTRNFPLEGGGLPAKNDVARMACGPFETAISPANVRRGFRDSGIFPLSLEVMLQKMVGAENSAHRPHWFGTTLFASLISMVIKIGFVTFFSI